MTISSQDTASEAGVPIGVAWYPEQHPPEHWPSDVRRMREAGLSLVRVGEFAWGAMEPEEGRFELGWLERVVDLLGDAGLGVVLGTPTAAPPVWLSVSCPEILSVGPDGVRRAYGSRRFTCPTSPAFRAASARIAGEMVRRLGWHPAVIGWQVDNEPGNHDSARCWCDLCEAAFARWLADRYGTVAALDEAWGTRFWSGTYPSFETVRLPRPTNASHSPSLLMAHRRFSSGQALDAVREQHDIVAAGAPGRPILVNVVADEMAVDARALARIGGTAAIDLYPHGHGTPDDQGFLLEVHRGHTGTAWIMEHQPGPINWTPTTGPVWPGEVRLWGWRAVLHGYEAFLFFSWQPTRSGSEQYHTGLLRHDGSDDRGLAEATRLARELALAGDGILRRPPAPVAVTWSIEDAWAIEIDPHRAGLTHQALCVAAYAAARRLGWEVDAVDPESDLRGYRVVLAPALHIATPARLARIEEALEGGTAVLLGPRSLVRDVDACWLDVPLPGGLAPRLGTRVTDWFGLHEELWAALDEDAASATSLPVGPWADVLEEPAPSSGARVVARYADGPFPGAPAVVSRDRLTYVGLSSTEAWEVMVASVIGTGPAGRAGEGEERFVREGRTIVLDHARVRTEGLPDVLQAP